MNNVDDDGTTSNYDWKSEYDKDGESWNGWTQNYDNQSWTNGSDTIAHDQRSSTTETNTVGQIGLHHDTSDVTTTASSRYAIMGVLPQNKHEGTTDYLLVD